MDIQFGTGKTKYGPGVQIDLSGEEVARAISTYLISHGIYVDGARTITVNGELCKEGGIYVDPSGAAVSEGIRYTGRGIKEICI